MSENTGGSDRLTYLLIGAGIGAALALLFAPKPGRELRGDIARATRQGYKKGSELAHAVGEKVSEGYGAVRGTIEGQKAQLGSAIDAGKQAYRDERKRSDS